MSAGIFNMVNEDNNSSNVKELNREIVELRHQVKFMMGIIKDLGSKIKDLERLNSEKTMELEVSEKFLAATTSRTTYE